MNVIRYNYDTKCFSSIEVRLFTDDNQKAPKKGWKLKNKDDYDKVNKNPSLKSEFAKARQKTWGEYKKWCKSKGFEPSDEGGGKGKDKSDGGGGGSYDKTDTAGTAKNEGSGTYNVSHKFQDDFKIGKMNARKYTTVRLLKERLNELMEDGTIDDVTEDGNYNYVVRIRKTTGTGEKSKGSNYVYIGIYVIDDHTYGLVRWDLEKGGTKAEEPKNATIAGPENLRQVIKGIQRGEMSMFEKAKDRVTHPWKSTSALIGWVLSLAANTIGFVSKALKNWGNSR